MRLGERRLNSNRLQFIETMRGDDIIDCFHRSDSALESVIRLGSKNLSWLVSKIMCAPDGSGDPLILLPFQSIMLEALWNRKFPMIMAARGGGKTFLLGLYSILRAMLCPGEEIVAIGKAFRQSKKVFEYAERIYNTSPIVKEAVDGSYSQFNVKRKDAISHGSDRYEMHFGLSKLIALPIGDGESIRGQRATVLLVDEFASVNEEVLEIVITPFLSVHKNPQKSTELHALLRRLDRLGVKDEIIEHIAFTQGKGNQMVVSGTASNRYNHFYRYWQHYRQIINSKGDSKLIRRALSERTGMASEQISIDDIQDVCDTWREYCIYRLPYTSMPRGYLDQAMVARNRITFSSARFKQEYLCEFPDETSGFIPMSLIMSATPKPPDQIPVNIELYGEHGARYVMGIDPARNQDYFAISIVKLKGNSEYQFVYCRAWQQRDYPTIVAFLLELLRRFNIVLMVMDPGGGGNIMRDLLCDPNTVKNRNEIVWDKEDDRSHYKSYGRKILHMQTFTNAWTDEAIHGMRADIEHQRMQFPMPSIVQSDDMIMGQYSRYVNKPLHEIFTKNAKDEWTTSAERIVKSLNEDLIGIENAEGDRIEDGIIDHVNEAICEICSIVPIGVPGVSSAVKYDLPKIDVGVVDVRHRDRYTATLLASFGARIMTSIGAHKIGYIPTTGTTPQFNKRAGKSSNVRTGRTGSSMSVDYSDYYKKQQENG